VLIAHSLTSAGCFYFRRWEFDTDIFDRALAKAQTRYIGLAAAVAAASDEGGGPAKEPVALGMWTSHGPYSAFLHTLVPGLETTESPAPG
jgi:hypothetical protein